MALERASGKRRAQDSNSDEDQRCFAPDVNAPPTQHMQRFSDISASGHSRQHVGNVYNAFNLRVADQDDAKAKRIIDSLYFPEIDSRRNNVSLAAGTTFEWLMDPGMASREETVYQLGEFVPAHSEHRTPCRRLQQARDRRRCRIDAATKLRAWLIHGHGVFWISGEAASGKSTLMKFLMNAARTHHMLGQWAAGATLLVADHYFWHPGSSMEKSYEGLYRTLLYKILRADPKLVRVACPRKWDSKASLAYCWSRDDFLDAITNLSTRGIRLCLFIDGLDEFHPQYDHHSLTQVILRLAAMENVKICVSSRPWTAFQEGLSDVVTLTLQDVNWIDIETFLVDNLRSSVSHNTGLDLGLECPLGDEAGEFVHSLVSRSRGVFLWIHLVLQRISARIKFVHRVEDLTTIVMDFPQELEEYFRNLIYDRISPAWKDSSETAAVLTLMLAGRRDIITYWTIMTGSALRDPDFGIHQDLLILPDSWFREQTILLSAFLRDTCADLVVFRDRDPDQKDIASSSYIMENTKIEFIHSSAYDFLCSDDMQAVLKRHAPVHFRDTHLLHIQTTLSSAKILPDASPDLDRYCHMQARLHELIWPHSAWHSHDHGTGVPIHVVRHHEQQLLELAKLVKDPLEMSVVESIEPQFVETAWWFSAHGLYSLSMQLWEHWPVPRHWNAAILSGTLCAGTFLLVGKLAHDWSAVYHIFDEAWSLSKVCESDVKRALIMGGDPNGPSARWDGLSGRWYPHGATDRCSIWHEFLSKWWRSDPRQSAKGYDHDGSLARSRNRTSPTEPDDRFASFAASEATALDYVRIWRIARLLIESDASLHGTFCLTNHICSEPEPWLGDYATKPVCQRVNVVQALRALVPGSCATELNEMLLWRGRS